MAIVSNDVSLENNEIKFYHHDVLQKLNAEDINRLSGANLIDSAFAELLKGIKGFLGKPGEFIAFGFTIFNQTASSFEVSPGVILSSTGIYQYPGGIFTPSDNAVWGKIEFRLVDTLGDPVSKQLFKVSSKTFQSEVGPSRKIHKFLLKNTYETTNSEPGNSVYYQTLITYKRPEASEPLSEIIREIETLNDGQGFKGSSLAPNSILDQNLGSDIKIGSLAELEAAFTGPGRTSAIGALNFLYSFSQAKNFIRTIPGGGFDDGIFRVRTQGNLAYWDKGDGIFRPFA